MAKLLATRLKPVIRKLISIKQSTFIPGRNILDGVLMVSEALGLAKRDKRGCLVLNVDYEKSLWHCVLELLEVFILQDGIWCEVE